MRWLALLFWLALCFSVAGISGNMTAAEIPGWYKTLVRPSIAPPDWLFGPVWSLLYALMAIAAWRVGLAASSPMRNLALGLFVTQLAFNFAWSLIFFRWHAIGAAFIEVAALWSLIAASILAFSHVDQIAAWMMVPYLAWVSFASLLNFAFWRLNRS